MNEFLGAQPELREDDDRRGRSLLNRFFRHDVDCDELSVRIPHFFTPAGWVTTTVLHAAAGGITTRRLSTELEGTIDLQGLPGLDEEVPAGWLHYMAFDLFIGGWEVRIAGRERISHWLVVPCPALTLFAGPIGLLLFLTLRYAPRR